MFYVNQPKLMTHFWIFITLLLVMLTAWGCDHSVEMPTTESVEVRESVKREPDASLSAAPAAANTIPLNRYWNAISTDYLTIAQPKPPLGAPAQGHVFQAVVGQIFPALEPGTVPLRLYWHNTRKDYLTTTLMPNAVPAGYGFVRIEGFVFQRYLPQPPGTVRLRLYRNIGLEDYFTTTANALGYVFVRTEGYVIP